VWGIFPQLTLWHAINAAKPVQNLRMITNEPWYVTNQTLTRTWVLVHLRIEYVSQFAFQILFHRAFEFGSSFKIDSSLCK
jgi:hypothetical protein